MDPEELQRLVERMLNTKRGAKVMYTADRLRLEGRRLGLEEGIGQGIEQGEDRALRRTLLRQLRLRFRVKASSVKAMVQSAALSQVQRWLDRMVLAATLDEVFREG